jgi:hypothetical protein
MFLFCALCSDCLSVRRTHVPRTDSLILSQVTCFQQPHDYRKLKVNLSKYIFFRVAFKEHNNLTSVFTFPFFAVFKAYTLASLVKRLGKVIASLLSVSRSRPALNIFFLPSSGLKNVGLIRTSACGFFFFVV